MDLRQLEQFIAVYEEGSFSRAARRENCTQPGLSVQIRNLEDEFGVALFTRSRRGVEPTVAGKRLYARGLDILNSVAETANALHDLSSDVTGAITVGTVPSVSRSALPAALSRFVEAHPNVELRLDEAYGGTLTERVAAGELDFAVVTSAVSHEGIEATLLAEHEMALVSGPDSGLKHLEPLALKNVPPLRIVQPTRRHAIRALIDTHLARADVEIAASIESDGLNTTLEYVRHSGWSTLTAVASVIDAADSGTLVINPIVRPRAELDYYLVRQVRAPLTGASERLVQLLREELAAITRRWRTLSRRHQ
ncbi:MAG: LysR family transcriptional regulator [Alphaproteobacteria bacterium]|nr:LysR family transcriptional regulator [Alphaproteobacteria bacterium]